MQTLQIGTCRINPKFKKQNAKFGTVPDLSRSVGIESPTTDSGQTKLSLNYGPQPNGFTIIELAVVIFIISLAMALIMPSFWNTEKGTLKREAMHISNALRYIYDEAIGKKQTYLFNINFDNKSWGFESKKEFRSFRIKGNVEIRDVVVPSLGEVSRGEVIIEFGPMGPEEPIILHLKKGESEYTVILNHLNGRTKILEGYEL